MAVGLGYKNVFRDPLGYPEWSGRGLPTAQTPAGLSAAGKESTTTFGPLSGWSMIWTLLGIFAGGMALNLTPCVYPLIPITVSYFGGQSGKKRGALFGHGLCYVGGLALTNSVLGVVAAITGGLMGAMLQNPLVLGLVSSVLLLFASSLFGFWELRLPARLTQAASRSCAGYFGSVFMGVTLGVVAAPCIGPFVLGLLTWVAGLGNPYFGFLIFFTLSTGLGFPLFFLAIFSGEINRLPRSGEWMIWVRKLMGWVLVGMAAYFIRPVLSETAGIYIMVIVALAAGLHLGWLDGNTAASHGFAWIKTIAGVTGLVLAVYIGGSFALNGPGVGWRHYSDRLLSEATEKKSPVIIDFTASWCAPCRELDDITFHDPEVVKQAEADFMMIKVDLTRKGDPLHEGLLKKYDVRGVPTIVFLNREGTEDRHLRLMDFEPPEKFLVRMAEIKKQPADS